MNSQELSTLPDAELIEKAKEDIDAFGVLIEKYEQPLMRYVLRISSFSPEEAEEILQEVFLKAWKNLNDFDRTQKFSSWIYRITHNQTISEFRKGKSRGNEMKNEWNEELFSNLPGTTDIKEEFGKELNAEILRKSITHLPEKYKTALVLRFWEEKSYDEIGDILKIPTGSVATLVSRAKKELKKTLERLFLAPNS